MANAGALTPITRWVVFDDGAIVSGAKLYTYLSGTSTPWPVYNNADLAPGNAHTNPVVADSEGVLPVIYLDAVSYRFLITTSAGATVFPAQDDVYDFAQLGSDTGVDVTATAGEDLLEGQAAYISASTGTWFKADADAVASSSEAGTVGILKEDIASGETGAVRIEGRLSYTFAALVPGSKYFVSATGGSLTATEPSNARYVGTADATDSIIITANPFTTSGSAGLNLLQIEALLG